MHKTSPALYYSFKFTKELLYLNEITKARVFLKRVYEQSVQNSGNKDVYVIMTITMIKIFYILKNRKY
jgi:hypothetical protein